MYPYFKPNTGGTHPHRSIKNAVISSVAIAALVTTGVSFAKPVVNDLEISWPDDGWYQVQTADGLTSICAGTRSCLVEPGTYIVINHTTGERFNNIYVADLPASTATNSATTVSVDGNTISWPDDGWYQVQSATTFESFCEGESQCTVEDGTYQVINHTTGERFKNIVVFSGNAGGDAATVMVAGNTISWPDDGWYQVQSADTYESICNGGKSCQVSPGAYIVINHTTGERFTRVVFEGDDVTDSASNSRLALDSLANDILLEFAGYRLDESASFAPAISAGIIAASTDVIALNRGNFTYEYRGEKKVLPIKRDQYACPAGGTMTLGSALSMITESDHTRYIDYTIYDFDNCRATVEDEVPVPDTYLANGSLTTLHESVAEDGSRMNIHGIIFADFNLRGESGFTVTTDASISTRSSIGSDSSASRNVSISEHVMQLDTGVNAQPLVSIKNAKLLQKFSNTANGSLQSYSLDTSGVFSGELTDGVEVTVSTLEPLARVQGVGVSANQNVPFNGRVLLRAADDTELTINANPDIGEDQSLLVNYRLRTADGKLTDSLGESFSDELSKVPF